MKKAIEIGLMVFVACMFVLAIDAYAESGIMPPEGTEVFYVEDHFCVQWEDGSGDCYCPCEGVECEELVVKPTPRPTDKPGDTPTSIPPTDIPPTDTPPTEIPSTPTPRPEKPKCNRGLGNLSEDCDPGQSGGNPGSAGEDNE